MYLSQLAAKPAINLPLFDAGALRANLAEKYAAYDVVVEQYNQSVINAMQQVADQISLLKSLYAQEISQRSKLQSIDKIYQLTQLRYRQGIDSNINVLQTKLDWLTQQDFETQLKAQQMLATIGLINALGGYYGKQ